MEYAIFYLFGSVLLGLIPAIIASNKDHDFFLWWFFGAMLFIIALPVAIVIQPRRDVNMSQIDVVDKLDKLHRLRSQGVINDAQYEAMKNRTLVESRPVRTKYDPSVPANPRATWIVFMFILLLIAVLVGIAAYTSV